MDYECANTIFDAVTLPTEHETDFNCVYPWLEKDEEVDELG